MAKVEQPVSKIKCARCGKGLGTSIGAYGQSQVIPGLLPDVAYTASSNVIKINGTLYPIMCLECAEKYEKGIE